MKGQCVLTALERQLENKSQALVIAGKNTQPGIVVRFPF